MEKILMSKTLKDPNFFGSHDLVVAIDENDQPKYGEKTLTIKTVKLEEINDMELIKTGKKNENGTQTKEAYVLHFVEKNKPYVVKAAEVIEGIEKATGTKVVNRWEGKQITFYVKKDVKAFGKKTDALRVRPTAPIKKGQPIFCVDCGAEIVEGEIDGKTYSADIIAKASLNKFGKIICLECKNKPTLEDAINNLEE